MLADTEDTLRRDDDSVLVFPSAVEDAQGQCCPWRVAGKEPVGFDAVGCGLGELTRPTSHFYSYIALTGN